MSLGSNRGYLLASEFGHKTQGEGAARKSIAFSLKDEPRVRMRRDHVAVRGGELPRDCVVVRGDARGVSAGEPHENRRSGGEGLLGQRNF